MNLMQDTLASLESRGKQTAIINQKGQELSFADFFDLTTKMAQLLRERGVGKGSKVLILANLDSPLYCALASCFQLGAIVVLVDPWANSSYIERALGQVEPDFLIISKRARIFYLKKAIRQIPRKILLDELCANKTTERFTEIASVESSDTALITFTSGTTGIPKGFDRSHEFLLAQQEAHDKYFQHHEGEIDLTMYPVFVLSNLKSGMTSVLIKGNLRKIDTIQIDELYQQLDRYKVDSLSVSPVILDKLLTYCEKKDLKLGLKKIFTGGAPVTQSICERVCKLNPNGEGIVIYGSTEAEPIALLSMREVAADPDSIRKGTPLGRVVDALRYELLPLGSPTHPFHQGKVGEVSLTGKYVGKRYWNNPEAFRETKWVDEKGEIWHKTGDVVLQEGALLFMIGRKSTSITTPEGNLYPVPIENIIDRIPGVKKAAYLQHKEKILIAYSGERKAKSLIESTLRELKLPLDSITRLRQIPMDSRHRSKIDLPTLKSKL